MNLSYPSATSVLAAGLLFASAGLAQTAKTDSEKRGPGSFYTIRASDVIGATVINADNVELGTVDDIVMVRSSAELHAIIASGGLLGIGEDLYAVPLVELKAGSDDNRVFLDISRSRFEQKPPFQYVDGESSGLKIWEKRLELKKKIADRQKDAKEERKEVLEKKRQILKLQRELEELQRK